MKFWWEALAENDWRNALKTELFDLPKMEAKRKMLEFRRRTDRPKTTPVYSLAPGGSGTSDSTGRFVISMEELDEKIEELYTHCSELRIAIECLPEGEKKIIEGRYLCRKQWKEIEHDLSLEKWQRENIHEKAICRIRETLEFAPLFIIDDPQKMEF